MLELPAEVESDGLSSVEESMLLQIFEVDLPALEEYKDSVASMLVRQTLGRLLRYSVWVLRVE